MMWARAAVNIVVDPLERSRRKASVPSRPRPSLRQSAAQDLGEDDGVVVLGVPGGVDEGEGAVAGPPPQLCEPRALAPKLLDVAPTKLFEATRLVPEPLPKLRARR
jgi:hypothetical protein